MGYLEIRDRIESDHHSLIAWMRKGDPYKNISPLLHLIWTVFNPFLARSVIFMYVSCTLKHAQSISKEHDEYTRGCIWVFLNRFPVFHTHFSANEWWHVNTFLFYSVSFNMERCTLEGRAFTHRLIINFKLNGQKDIPVYFNIESSLKYAISYFK